MAELLAGCEQPATVGNLQEVFAASLGKRLAKHSDFALRQGRKTQGETMMRTGSLSWIQELVIQIDFINIGVDSLNLKRNIGEDWVDCMAECKLFACDAVGRS